MAGTPPVHESSQSAIFWHPGKRSCSKEVARQGRLYGSSHRRSPGPRIRRKNLVQGRMLHRLMPFHHARDGPADLLETDLPVAECLHSSFIGRVEHGGDGGAALPGPAGGGAGKKTIAVRFF